MESSGFALWLNEALGGFDFAVLQGLHGAAEAAGFLLTPLLGLVSLLGENGIVFFLASIVLMVFPRTRKAGICMFVAVCIGALFTSFIIKDLVARPRPFETLEVYQQWWMYVGSPEESGFSFPSGHVTAAMAAMTALFLCSNKRVAWTGFFAVVLMAISRNYFMVHYPTDVIAAMVVGACAAVLAVLLFNSVVYQAQKRQMAWVAVVFPKTSKKGAHNVERIR